jgi:hypothetical protein
MALTSDGGAIDCGHTGCTRATLLGGAFIMHRSVRVAVIASLIAAVAITFALVLVPTALVAPVIIQRSSVPATVGAAPVASSLMFERNDGQHPASIRFAARGAGYRMSMLDDGVALALSTANGPVQLTTRFDGARGRRVPQGERPLSGRVNYFVGNDPRAWRQDVPAFASVRYPQVYDGVDVVFYGTGQQLEYDVVVSPAARPESARLRFDGAQSVRVEADGSLAVGLPNGEFRYTKPVAYQLKNGVRQPVDAAYRIDGEVVMFEVGEYDRSSELVIDPVLVFSTFLGGSNFDIVNGVTVDAAGATYVTGQTGSSDFPVSSNAPKATIDVSDAFVTKLSRDGATIVYSTFFGGTNVDGGSSIGVDASGAAYIAGWTGSVDLPVTSGAFQHDNAGGGDAFVAKLSPAGNRLVYATFLGGNDDDAFGLRASIAVDPAGIATIAASTESGDFPTTPGALQRTHTPGPAAIGYAARLNATGTGLMFSTLLTGAGDQRANAVALDAQGRAIVVGDIDGTMTTTTTLGPTGGRDSYVLKLNASGSALVFSTRFGGSGSEGAFGLTYDPNRDVAFIVGGTGSADFPATGIQGRKGESDAFLITVGSNGSGGFYSALLGGSGLESATAVGSSGDYITLFGLTTSSDFPVVNPLQPYRASYDAFVTRLRGSVNILFSTTLGGSNQDILNSGVIDGAGAATFGGETNSTNFPVAHAAQPVHGADSLSDGFVARTALAPRGTAGPHDVVVRVADVATLHGDWEKLADSTAAGGSRLHNPDRGRPKVDTPLAAPTDYFEFTVNGLADGQYRLWLRGKADGNSFVNDSVWVQFERAQNSGSDADDERDIFRIGTTEAMAVVVEDCTNCGLRGWGWQDGGYGQKLLGTPLYFNSEAAVTIRVQRREDGVSIDQIVIAKDDAGEGPNFASAPGYQKDDDTILPAQDPFGGRDTVIRLNASSTIRRGNWIAVADPTAADGEKVRHPDQGAAKVLAPLASPTHYIDVPFAARAGVGYRIWIRGRADADFYGNDSAYVQFSDSVDSAGNPMWRIGTTSATTYVLEECSGCSVQGWGWNDNAYGEGALGPLVYFATDRDQTLRIQTREDGLSLDQIVLSAERYLTAAPGKTKNDDTIVSPF